MDTTDVGLTATRLAYRRRESVRVNASHGKGVRCSSCGQPITAEQIQYELEANESAEAGARFMHFDCFNEWCKRRQPKAPSS
jgi:DNA-directed RNA polymerase subunit N (RpoN/RPB10)